MQNTVSLDEKYIRKHKKYYENNKHAQTILTRSKKHIAFMNKHKGNIHHVLNELEDGESLFLYACIVHKVMDLSNLEIAHACIFENVRFEKDFIANNTVFHKGLTLSLSDLDGNLELSHTNIKPLETNIDSFATSFFCDWAIRDTTIMGNIMISHSLVSCPQIEYVTCHGTLTAYQTHFLEGIFMEDCTFQGINFTNSIFGENSHIYKPDEFTFFHLGHSTCIDTLSLDNAIFYKNIEISNVETKNFSTQNIQYKEMIQKPIFIVKPTNKDTVCIETKQDK